MKKSGIIHIFTFFIILASCLIIMNSCNKELDVDQIMSLENDKAITSAKDLEAVMAGAYDGLQSGNVLAGNMLVYSELLADDSQVNEDKLFNFGTKEIYSRATTVQLNPLRDMWRDAYSTINRVNNVIAAIDGGKISGADFDAVKDKLKGEALFIRAVVHYSILQFWALPYDVDKQGQNTQLGVPYRTQPTTSGFVNLAMARNTVEDVYNKVIDDLIKAEALLDSVDVISPTSKNPGRANAMACAAYLAKVYFNKGDYINASDAANRIIKSKNFLLNDDLRQVFQTSGDKISDEIIFQLVNIQTDQSNAISYNFAPTDNTVPLFMPDTVFKKLFWDANDLRRTKYITINNFANTLSVRKYRSANPADNICILRFAEMHLIRAESNLLANVNIQDAYESYNAIQKRAYGSKWVAQSITQDALLDSVRLERRRELCFEGDRFHNLRRMKQNVRSGVKWNDPSLLFKIPQEEMSGNPLMVQNP
jgi:tetratricopeptide (TPR) repeat protein